MKPKRIQKPLLAIAACAASAWAAAQGGVPGSTSSPGTMECSTASANNADALCGGALSSGTSAAGGALVVPPEPPPARPMRRWDSDGAPNGADNDGGSNLPGNNSTGNNTIRGADRSNQNTKSGD